MCVCVWNSRQDEFRKENCSEGLPATEASWPYLSQTDSTHSYMDQIRDWGGSSRVHRLKFSIDLKMSPRHEWARHFSSASSANDGFTRCPQHTLWAMPGLLRYSSLSSHAEAEIVVKQTCFYGAEGCETELIRAWHIELDGGMKWADDSIVSAKVLPRHPPNSVRNWFVSL